MTSRQFADAMIASGDLWLVVITVTAALSFGIWLLTRKGAGK
jgi:hypothetical protein